MKPTTSKRRPLTLMEVMIALLIIALCAIPLMAPAVKIYREERRFVDKLRLDRAVGLLFGEIVIKLHQNEIPWSAIESEQSFNVDPEELQRLVGSALPFKGQYQFIHSKHKPEEKDLFTVYLYRLSFTFTETNSKTPSTLSYNYDLFIARDLTARQENQPSA